MNKGEFQKRWYEAIDVCFNYLIMTRTNIDPKYKKIKDTFLRTPKYIDFVELINYLYDFEEISALVKYSNELYPEDDMRNWTNRIIRTADSLMYYLRDNIDSDTYNKIVQEAKTDSGLDAPLSTIDLATTDDIKKAKIDMENQVAKIVKDLESIRNLDTVKERKEARDLVSELKKQKKKSEEIIGAIAYSENGARYEEYAKRNKSHARWLFWTGLIIMFIICGISIHLYWNMNEIKPMGIIAKIPLLLLMLLPALFIMRESKKLKIKEFQYHDMACRIVTADTYINGLNLDKKKSDELKGELVMSFFARPMECYDEGGLHPITDIKDTTEAITRMVCAIKEK